MPIREFTESSKSCLSSIDSIDFSDIYVCQVIADLHDTLMHQEEGKPIRMTLVANQLHYPYLPISDTNAAPQLGYYPPDFIAPNIYILRIPPEFALENNCEACAPIIYANANFSPTDATLFYEEEDCLSFPGIKGYNVPRHDVIEVSAHDEQGNVLNFKAEKQLARMHQHAIERARGESYLQQFHFSSAELQKIITWIAQNKPNKKIPQWIIEGKLECVSESINLEPLETWARAKLQKDQQTLKATKPSFFKSVITQGLQVLKLEKPSIEKDLLRFLDGEKFNLSKCHYLKKGDNGTVYYLEDYMGHSFCVKSIPKDNPSAENDFNISRLMYGEDKVYKINKEEVDSEFIHFIIPYFKGITLSDLAKNPEKNPRFTIYFKLDIFVKLLEKIEDMHAKNGILHNDLKSLNIIVDLEKQEPFIIDFGRAICIFDKEQGNAVASLEDLVLPAPVQAPTLFKPTVALMTTFIRKQQSQTAPELAMNQPQNVGIRSDYFGLGNLFKELIPEHASLVDNLTDPKLPPSERNNYYWEFKQNLFKLKNAGSSLNSSALTFNLRASC